MTTPEQQAREMLERMGIGNVYERMSAGELVELANLIAENTALKAELERVKAERDDWGKRWHQERRKVAELQYPGMTGVVKPMAEELAAIKQGSGEPVAWVVTSEKQDGTRHTYALMGREKDVRDACDFGEPIPLYPRPCVPLTNEQVWSIAGPHITHYQFGEATHRDINCLGFARALEAAHNIKGAKP